MSFLPGLFGGQRLAPTTTPTPAGIDRLDYPVGPGGYHPPPRLLRRGDLGSSKGKGKGGMSKSALSAMTVMSFMFFLQMLEMSMEKLEEKMMMTSTMAPAPGAAPSTVMIMSRKKRDALTPEDQLQEVDSIEVVAEPPVDNASDGKPIKHSDQHNTADPETERSDGNDRNSDKERIRHSAENSVAYRNADHHPDKDESTTNGEAANSDQYSSISDSNAIQYSDQQNSGSDFELVSYSDRGNEDASTSNKIETGHEDLPQDDDFELQLESSPVDETSDLQHSAADIYYCSGLLVCETRRLVGHAAANLLSGTMVWLSGHDENYAKMLTEATESARESGGCKKHIHDCQHEGKSNWLPLIVSVLENLT